MYNNVQDIQSQNRTKEDVSVTVQYGKSMESYHSFDAIESDEFSNRYNPPLVKSNSVSIQIHVHQLCV